MKVSNIDRTQSADSVRGRRSTNLAGAKGMIWRDGVTESVGQIRDMTVIGIAFTDNDDGTGVLTFGSNPGSPELGTWESYTPTLTATVTDPTIGDGALSGRYKMFDIQTLSLSITYIVGATSTAGSGAWSFALPPGMTAIGFDQILAGHILDASAAHYVMNGRVGAGDTKVTEMYAADTGAARVVAHNLPMAWAVNDTIQLTGIIQIA